MGKSKIFLIILSLIIFGGGLIFGFHFIPQKPKQEAEEHRGTEEAEVENIEKGGANQVMLDKKILMIIAPENFRDAEYLEPREVFENAGVQVIVASKGVAEAQGADGAVVKVDLDIADVSVDDFDAVVFIGGMGSQIYFDDSTVHQIARQSSEKGKITAAICIAPSILANAGILQGKSVTAFSSEKDNLITKGANYTGENVTVDGSIVTGNGPAAARKFGEVIVKSLSH